MKKVNLSDSSQVRLVELTRNGLCVELANQTCFFCDNVGNFRRYATTEEVDSIRFNLSPITFQGEHLSPVVELPEKWRFLWSWKISDYTSYKPETCNNGGDYAFHQEHNIFGRIRNERGSGEFRGQQAPGQPGQGKLELLDVVRHITSAEFSYDEANGSFQSDGMAYARFIDCEDGDFTLYTQTGNYEDGYVVDREYSLNQFGESISISDALMRCDDEIENEKTFSKVISQEENASRLKTLKDTFNWELTKRR